jgi:hypothetical protein
VQEHSSSVKKYVVTCSNQPNTRTPSRAAHDTLVVENLVKAILFSLSINPIKVMRAEVDLPTAKRLLVKFERVTNKLPKIIINAQKIDTSTTAENDAEIDDENDNEDSKNNNDGSERLVEVMIEKNDDGSSVVDSKNNNNNRSERLVEVKIEKNDNGSLVNRIPVMAPILAPILGVYFFSGAYLPKNRTYCPLFRQDTTFFRDT